MPSDAAPFRRSIRRLTLLLGVAQITLGCLAGLLPPDAVPWFRGLVMAHVEYTGNGVLLIALGLLVPELWLSRAGMWSWFISLQLGTWLNGSAALVAALTGRSSRLLSLANRTSPPPAGTMDVVVTGMLFGTAMAMIVGLALTLYGLVRGWSRLDVVAGREPRSA